MNFQNVSARAIGTRLTLQYSWVSCSFNVAGVRPLPQATHLTHFLWNGFLQRFSFWKELHWKWLVNWLLSDNCVLLKALEYFDFYQLTAQYSSISIYLSFWLYYIFPASLRGQKQVKLTMCLPICCHDRLCWVHPDLWIICHYFQRKKNQFFTLFVLVPCMLGT